MGDNGNLLLGKKFRLAYAFLVVLFFTISIVVWFKRNEKLHVEYPTLKSSDQIYDKVVSLISLKVVYS